MSIRGLSLILAGSLAWAVPVRGAEELSASSFTRIHQLIRPQTDESRWREVSWQTSIWEARRQAAAAGKPILIWSGGGAAPIGGC